MRYIALIRKLNAGSENRIKKDQLQEIFISLNYNDVKVYINSGNVVFDSNDNIKNIKGNIEKSLTSYFANDMQVIILNKNDFKRIADQIPNEWKNDEIQRTDVAFLFDNINNVEILNSLPFNEKYITVKYINNALIWNLQKTNYNKSRLGKIIMSDLYKNMTLRNINTVRELYKILINSA